VSQGGRNTLAVVRENVVQVIVSQCGGRKAAYFQHENFDGLSTIKDWDQLNQRHFLCCFCKIIVLCGNY